MLNGAMITTDAQLLKVLADLGFECEPLSMHRRLCSLGLPIEERGQAPCCLIPWMAPNRTGERVLVSVEKNQFCVYWYNVMDDDYSLWEDLGERVSMRKLHDTIRTASSEEIMKRMPTLEAIQEEQRFRNEIRKKFGGA